MTLFWRVAEHMATDFPDWKDVDLADPSGCIDKYLADREAALEINNDGKPFCAVQ